MDATEAAAVLARARQGDSDAFRALVERHSRAVFRLAYRMTGNESDAEDMVQETFLRAWKQLDRFDGRAAFGSWLYRICANCSLDHIRARSRHVDPRPERKEGGETEDLLDRMPSPGPSPERLARSSEITAMLLPALDELSEMERTAFVMRHYEGLSIDDIAGALGVPAGAAKHS